MGLMSGMRGNATAVDPAQLQQEYGQLFGPEEAVHSGYQLVRDVFIFTNRRLILVDKQGMTGKKVEYLSVPYRSITRFAVETAGTFDLDAELKVWTAGHAEPIQKQFHKGVNIYEVQGLLAWFVCGA